MGAVLLPFYRFSGLAVDAPAYLNIARQHADGAWGDAVNSYWSPLYSWLLALGIDGSTALRVVGLAAGAAALLSFLALLRRLAVDSLLIEVVSLGIAPYTLRYSLTASTGLTPDLAFSALILACLTFCWESAPNLRSGSTPRIDGLASGLRMALAGVHVVLTTSCPSAAISRGRAAGSTPFG